MALTLYTDTYAELAAIDARMVYNVGWNTLAEADRENRIKAASLQIDDMMFHGIVKVQGQDMKFPRNFGSHDFSLFDAGDDVFDEENQERILGEAVRSQVEYEMNRRGIGATQFSSGSQSVTPRQDMLCREAKSLLAPYVKY